MNYFDVLQPLMHNYAMYKGERDWFFDHEPYPLAKKAWLRLGSALYGMEVTTGDDWDESMNGAVIHDLMDVIALCTLAIEHMPKEGDG